MPNTIFEVNFVTFLNHFSFFHHPILNYLLTKSLKAQFKIAGITATGKQKKRYQKRKKKQIPKKKYLFQALYFSL